MAQFCFAISAIGSKSGGGCISVNNSIDAQQFQTGLFNQFALEISLKLATIVAIYYPSQHYSPMRCASIVTTYNYRDSPNKAGPLSNMLLRGDTQAT